jgi:hypothetical protein
MLVQVIMHPFFRETFDKQLVAVLLSFLFSLTCLHDSWCLPVEAHDSALEATNGREFELLKSFLSVIKLLELNKGKVEVLKHWSNRYG